MDEEVASKLEALNATADALKGDGSDSVDAMLVKPLQARREASRTLGPTRAALDLLF